MRRICSLQTLHCSILIDLRWSLLACLASLLCLRCPRTCKISAQIRLQNQACRACEPAQH